MADRILLMVIMIAAYGIGFALVRWTVGFLVPVRAVPLGLSLVMILMPLLVCMAFEWASELWDHTPGTLGLGSLTVATPMLLAGGAAGAAFLALRVFGPALAEGYIGRAEVMPLLLTWGWAAIGLTAVAFALYVYWPEPRPRLF